ncbi:MAG: menaquinone biosynthesis protein [Planctomycetota bacterium]|nr:menaquinone biosynthesis protein [Planctomycetota bacterium]
MTSLPSNRPGPHSAEPLRLGVVSFLNTLPLIEGLQDLRDVRLRHSVPSRLIDLLLADEVDVALCSSIDYQRTDQALLALPAGLLGCDGPTLTVRLYSMRPIERIERVHCDTDSHASVALLTVLLRELHGIDPVLVDYDAREHVAENRPLPWPEAMLIIGDKVVTDSPPAVRYPHQVDLGAAWARHTGLPFVFALWLAREEPDPIRRRRVCTAGAVLDRQRRYNALRLEWIVHHRAPARRWPRDLARRYLTENIACAVTAPRRRGLELFYDKAAEHGLIEDRRPLRMAAM